MSNLEKNPFISIHAPREGSDSCGKILQLWRSYFNPRSPRGERQLHMAERPLNRYFNPRSPRGERHTKAMDELAKCEISIHAPREGSDITQFFINIDSLNFNPRSPRGERPNQ